MRQLEGKVLATEGAKPRGKEQPAKYDKTKQGAAPALASQAKAYNADADVATESKEDKKKKVGVYVCKLFSYRNMIEHDCVGNV